MVILCEDKFSAVDAWIFPADVINVVVPERAPDDAVADELGEQSQEGGQQYDGRGQKYLSDKTHGEGKRSWFLFLIQIMTSMMLLIITGGGGGGVLQRQQC